jgi:flagellar hook-associated protein 3 FlgL
VAYFGDEGKREVAVSASRTIALNDPGSDVLMRIRSGNGTFVTAAGAANTGTGVVSQGAVSDAAALTGHTYSISFAVGAGGTTYTITDTTTASAVASNVAYVEGGPITFAGMQLSIDGAPANGDTFSVQPSGNVSLFATLDALRSTLNAGGAGAAGNTRLANGLNTANANLRNALDQVLGVAASVGTRLRETEAVTRTSEDLDLSYETRLSQLGDVDYARAISDLAFQQMHLEAAQKAFVRVSELSLFRMI